MKLISHAYTSSTPPLQLVTTFTFAYRLLFTNHHFDLITINQKSTLIDDSEFLELKWIKIVLGYFHLTHFHRMVWLEHNQKSQIESADEEKKKKKQHRSQPNIAQCIKKFVEWFMCGTLLSL